jgi:protein-disulfide isomerase
MARKKKGARTPGKHEARHPASSSGKAPNGKAVAVIAGAVAMALATAAFFAYRGAEPTTTPVDMAAAEAGASQNVTGPENPAVTLVEYGDYSCPTCARFYPIVAELMRRMPSELELEYHHYPIPVGPHSLTASFAAEAAAEQGRFWDMHDALFSTQSQWSGRSDARDTFISMAGQLGLDTARFAEDMDSPEIQGRVASDRRQGDAVGVGQMGTPSFFVNNRRLDYLPQSVDEFEAIIRTVMGQ